MSFSEGAIFLSLLASSRAQGERGGVQKNDGAEIVGEIRK